MTTRIAPSRRRLFLQSYPLTLLPAALSLPLLAGALCGDTAPKNAQELVQEQACVANLEKGDLDAAETRCEICLEYNERNAECLNNLGLVWFYRGDDARARSFFIKAIRENTDFAQPRSNMGALEFKALNFKEAVKFFESAVEIDPRFAEGRYNLALSWLRIGQQQIAKGLDPSDAFKNAETQYRRIFELFPNMAKAYHDMGQIMAWRAEIVAKTEKQKREYTKDAEQYFVRCLDIDNTYAYCHMNLAHLQLATGRDDEALFHYIQCLALNKNEPTCASELKIAYARSQLASEALKKYMDQLVQNPGYGQGHYGFCLALFDKGLVDMAVVECENALKLDNTICLAHYQLAKHYKTVLDKDLAVENCRGLIQCAGETKHASEVADCKAIVQALEVQ
jgi:tetratricopeptide (TPR) repeat protein